MMVHAVAGEVTRIPPGKMAVFVTIEENDILRTLIHDERDLTEEEEDILDGLARHFRARKKLFLKKVGSYG